MSSRIAVQGVVPRPKVDTKQVTFRLPSEWLSEAELLAKTIGFNASPTDALRMAIRIGFDEMAKTAGSVRVSAYDGVRSTMLFWVGDDVRQAKEKAKELASKSSGKWTTFRVFVAGQPDPIHSEPVREPKTKR